MQSSAVRGVHCRVGVTASLTPSTSGRYAGSVPQSHSAIRPEETRPQVWPRHHHRRDWRVGITNIQQELMGLPGSDPEDLDYIEIDQMQIPEPEKGPLEQRVSATYEDAIFTEEISPSDTRYWFTPPEEGWNKETKRVPKAQEVATEMPTAYNPGDGRISIDELQEGAEMTGVVTRLMLYHGAQIDLGTEYDGLIPVHDEEWTPELVDALWLDNKVRVRIHKVHKDTTLFRWPVQLELRSCEAAKTLPPPESHRPALDLRGRTSIEELVEDTGRTYKTVQYWADFNMQDYLNNFYGEHEAAAEAEHYRQTEATAYRISDIATDF